jgi:hypothetical protein
MRKEETPPIIRWLHRRIFRGLGWVFWAAVLSQAILFMQRSCHGRAH